MNRQAAIAKFWSKVEKTATCWLWRGAVGRGGYGRASYAGQTTGAHRIAFLLTRGPITEETLDHLCRNRLCVNPNHLEPVSNRENILRGESFAARNARVTHCRRGHPYSAANTRIQSGGGRTCRECEREKARERMRQRRSATATAETCKRGHSLGGRQMCRECQREYDREYKRKRRASLREQQS